MTLPGIAPADYAGGWIEAVDLTSGASEVLYRRCGDISLRGPNDLVFDGDGGFWFTEPARSWRGSATAARSSTPERRFVHQAGDLSARRPQWDWLSPDDRTLYVAESWSGRVWAYEITGPGQIRKVTGPVPWGRGRLLIGMGGYSVLDSLAIDSAGNVCVADIPYGGITVISPDGKVIERHPVPDIFVTNICFGGADLRTAYITLSSSGQLISIPWPRPGLPLHWLNRRP